MTKNRARKKIELSKAAKKFIILIAVFSLLLIVGAFAALFIGRQYPVTPLRVLKAIFGFRDGSSDANVVLRMRLPRALASIVVGAALSVSGTVYQGVFKNPLVSPDYLGVTGGASAGAAIAILLSLGAAFTALFAFVGGVAAILVAMLIPIMLRNSANLTLVLSGIIVGAAMASVLGFIKYTADPDNLVLIVYWTMGSFQYVSMREFLYMLPVAAVPAAALFCFSWRIDLLSAGETDARALGVNVPLVRGLALGCATLMTAASVCVAGAIGWVGLIVPHLGRMLVGPSNRKLMPLSAVTGGLLMLVADTLSRTIAATEMPVSILTGVIGVPFFIWLLYRQRKTLLY